MLPHLLSALFYITSHAITGGDHNTPWRMPAPRLAGGFRVQGIPDFKYGIIQAAIAIAYVTLLKINKRHIVYFLHDKQSHKQQFNTVKQLMTKFIINNANTIITHSQNGKNIIKQQYTKAINKTHYIDHPTKNHINTNTQNNKNYDLLVWGNIRPYKGVVELLQFLKQQQNNNFKPKLCIAGQCTKQIQQQITTLLSDNIHFIPQTLTQTKLQQLIQQSHFVLIPYIPKTVLSSATLMDSLAYGAKIIGPDTGAFHDYAQNNKLNVYTYNNISQLQQIIQQHRNDQVNIQHYAQFLDKHDWKHFAQHFLNIILTTPKKHP